MSSEAILPFGPAATIAGLLNNARTTTAEFTMTARTLPAPALAQTAADLETLGNLIATMQLAAAEAINHQDAAHTAESPTSFTWDVPDGRTSQFRNTAEYLRARLGISLAEARRRLRLASTLHAGTALTGTPVPPRYEHLAEATTTGTVSSADATAIEHALTHVSPIATADVLDYMEQSLTEQAQTGDTDALRHVIKHHINHIDQDGDEPTEAELTERQGLFHRGRHHGLTRFTIHATDTQAETLLTVMNTATNPRTRPCPAFHPDSNSTVSTATGSGDSSGSSGSSGTDGSSTGTDRLDGRTRPQKMLDGLVAGCQLALATGTLPATGGHRPQILATIDYNELLAKLTTTGDGHNTGNTHPDSTHTGSTGSTGSGLFAFTGPVTAKTIRALACDADIIPIIFGGDNEILDMGRAQRLYGPKARKAITARDHGCIFPHCTMPAPWTEVHHTTPWSEGGRTDIDTGVLACSFHHHLYHQGDWRIIMIGGTPWTVPPPYIDPNQRPQRNTYWDIPPRRESPTPAPARTEQPTRPDHPPIRSVPPKHPDPPNKPDPPRHTARAASEPPWSDDPPG